MADQAHIVKLLCQHYMSKVSILKQEFEEGKLDCMKSNFFCLLSVSK